MANEPTKYTGSEFMRTATGSTRDVLSVLLKPEQMYTEDEVSEEISAYLAKEVKK